MRRLMLVAMIAALLPVGGVRADGPSLADAAAKEKERRAKAAAPAKVVTEGDLKSNTGSTGAFTTTPTTGGSPAPGDAKPGDPKAAGAADSKEKTPDEAAAEAQKAWRDSLDSAQKNVQTIQASINDLQLHLNDMSGPMYGGARASQLEQMEALKKQLADAQQKVNDLQEQGRRSSYR